jgi:hypothetical protein
MWTTQMISESLGISREELYTWISKYKLKGEKKLVRDADGGFGTRLTYFFSEEQVEQFRRIHMFVKEGLEPREIRRALEGKPPRYRRGKAKQPKPMKVDRNSHPVLTLHDLESLVSQLTELEKKELASALKDAEKMYSKKIVYDFIDDVAEVVDDIEQAVEQLKENHSEKPVQISQLQTYTEGLKAKLNNFK